MKAQNSVDARLGVDELRAGFLKYSREAYALLPAIDRPRILDIGCGSGAATMELVRLSGSEVVGIDTDASALAEIVRGAQTYLKLMGRTPDGKRSVKN